MITYVVCDLFLSPARVLVNTVNTVGVMGKGIAKEFKQIYPDMFKQYQLLCERGRFDIGKLWLYKTPNKWVLNFPTKRYWRQPSRTEYIEAGLLKFAATYHQYGITDISFPLLGCGNGELDWETQVQPVMERYLQPLPIVVYIHLVHVRDPFAPEQRNVDAIKQWLRGEPESLAFAEVWEDLQAALPAHTNLISLDTNERFCAEVDHAGENVLVHSARKEITLPAEAFMDLWQQLRQAGFVTSDGLPSGLDRVANYVVAIMSRLPYVRPVQIANQHGKVDTRSIGMRLESRPRAPDRPLLASVGAVEPR
ncbi:MAG: macro domain-containing protein [Chloroflexi bacterium]|nr:macro domain-containing protein [Chloroflexota bacterium]